MSMQTSYLTTEAVIIVYSAEESCDFSVPIKRVRVDFHVGAIGVSDVWLEGRMFNSVYTYEGCSIITQRSLVTLVSWWNVYVWISMSKP